MNDQFFKDLSRNIAKEPLNQVLDPGSTGRRYEPSCGINKHNERIHRESQYSDNYKNLPFKFRKPPKASGRKAYIQCDNCGYISSGTTATVGIICSRCKKFSSVSEVEINE